MFCTAPACGGQLAPTRAADSDRRARSLRCSSARVVGTSSSRSGRTPCIRCEASSSSSSENSSFVPDRLPLAGADTDWREFRARLVAREGAASSLLWSSTSLAEPSISGSSVPAPGVELREGFWAHAVPGPEKGGVLLAHPLMFTTSQPYFRKSIIFLFEHGPDGSAGLILNLPTGHTIGSLGAAAAAACPEFGENALHLGGDVGDSTLHMMSSCPLEGSLEVGSGVYMGGYDAALRAVRDEREHPSNFKWFCKYSGWAPGQLQREVDAGVWFTAAVGRGVVLQQAGQGGAAGPAMWHQVLELMGGEYAQLSEAVKEEYRPDIMGQ